MKYLTLASLLFFCINAVAAICSNTSTGLEPLRSDVGSLPQELKVSANGQILFLGMSQCRGYVPHWRNRRQNVVNGCVSHWHSDRMVREWDAFRSHYLRELGNDTGGVELIMLLAATAGHARDNPKKDRARNASNIRFILDRIETDFPGVPVLGVSRIYGGYGSSDLSVEPHAHDQYLSVLDVAAKDPRFYPGPYLWADGLAEREDGLIWNCADFAPDGTHPGRPASWKVRDLLEVYMGSEPRLDQSVPALTLKATRGPEFEFSWEGEGVLTCSGVAFPGKIAKIPTDLPYDILHNCVVGESNIVKIGCRNPNLCSVK